MNGLRKMLIFHNEENTDLNHVTAFHTSITCFYLMDNKGVLVISIDFSVPKNFHLYFDKHHNTCAICLRFDIEYPYLLLHKTFFLIQPQTPDFSLFLLSFFVLIFEKSVTVSFIKLSPICYFLPQYEFCFSDNILSYW